MWTQSDGSRRVSELLGYLLLFFVALNVVMTCLRQAKPEWLTALWLCAGAGWVLLCARRLEWTAWLLVAGLPIFGARPGDLVTNFQDCLIVGVAAVSLMRFPLRFGRPCPPLAGWVLVGVALLSLLANAGRCFYPLRPLHQDNVTRNLFFMFAGSWDIHIGAGEWFMLLNMLLVARCWYRLLAERPLRGGQNGPSGRLRPEDFAAAVTVGFLAVLVLGYLEYFLPSVHGIVEAWQLRLYDFSDDTVNRWPLPAFLVSPVGPEVSMKSFFGNRGWFGQYLIAAGPVAMAWVAAKRAAWRRVCLGMLLGAWVLAVYLCGARAAALAAVAGIVLLLLTLLLVRVSWRRRLKSSIAQWVIWLALVSLVPLPGLIYAVGPDWAWLDPHYRDIEWDKAVRLVRAHPWLGVGYETFGHAARTIEPPRGGPPQAVYITPHNLFAQTAACTGLGGLLCVLLLFRVPIRAWTQFVARARLSPPEGASPQGTGLAFAFAMIFVCGFAQEWFYIRSLSLFFWLGLALLCALNPKAANRQPPAQQMRDER